MITVMTNRGMIEFDAKDWATSQSGILTLRSAMNVEVALFLPGSYGGVWQSAAMQAKAEAGPEAKEEPEK